VSEPAFVVAPPQSGAALLARTLARSPSLRFATPGLVGSLDQIADRHDSDRLTAADATADTARRLRRLLDEPDERRPLVENGRNALRVAFLAEVFPDATFIYLHREPAAALPSMVEAWESGRFVTHPDLPGWTGPSWSLPLVPGWRDLLGCELAEVVAQQWTRTARILLDDLEALPRERWAVVDIGALIARPEGELTRLCDYLGVDWTERLPVPLPTDGHLLVLAPERHRAHVANLGAVLGATRREAERAREWLARPREAHAADSPLRSVHTGSFPDLLRQLGTSLLVSTYQTGKLICIRRERIGVNTHFRDFDRPMGIAVRRDRIAVGTGSELVDLRNMPEAAAKLPPPGSHDACFLPRNRHFTGEIRIHDVAFARGELWVVATAFSCLATIDAVHSFVPRWAPPFISELRPDDRCHLNGLCVVDDEPRYVTALGETDEPGGWRERKADGGVVIDVESGETLLRGLSMPHSPRWHDGRLWLLESGRGALSVADLEAGTWETVAELPGFTRGLALAGPLAFVGLSQIRETVTFGGLPLTERVAERLCGVWVVDVRNGGIAGFLRFEDLVQEIFEVALMPGLVHPEIAEPTSDTALQSYLLPHGSAVPSATAR
jgi:uncharacterized protein (TIGR03032 family)